MSLAPSSHRTRTRLFSENTVGLSPDGQRHGQKKFLPTIGVRGGSAQRLGPSRDRAPGHARKLWHAFAGLTFSPGQKQGIICFDWVGPWAGFQAGGHVDLLRLVVDTSGKVTRLLPNCEGHCYFLPTLGPMRAYFWGTDP